MKKRIALIVGILVLGGLAWYAVTLIKGRGHSDDKFEEEKFAIKDTLHVDRVIITESNGMEYEIIRNGKTWTDKKGGCIQQQLAINVLDAAYNAHFKGYIPENAKKNVMNRMATVGTTVKFYVDGEWNKTWYIGSSTPDHQGTYMLLESADFGKSEEPVIVELENMAGIIGPRFFADPRKWMCTGIFAYQINEIASVEVKHIEHPERSFTVKAKGNKFSVYNNGKEIQGFNDAMVTKYLTQYRKINYELPNYELTPRQVDSVKASKAFCTLTLKTKKGETKTLKMFRRKSDTGEATLDSFGDVLTFDNNRMWCLLPDGSLVKCQYFVFDKITRGDIYFGFGR